MAPKAWFRVVLVGLSALSLGAAPAPERVVEGIVIAELGLNLRMPSNGGQVGDAVLTVPVGTTLEIFCVVAGGPEIPGPYGTGGGPYGPSTVWDGVSAYQPPGEDRHELGSGWLLASDAWVDTGGPTEQMGLPACSDAAPDGPGRAAPAPPPGRAGPEGR
jgi:hypothetical protein